MDYLQNRNLLEEIEAIGLKVTWTLILLGFKEYDSFQIGLSSGDLIEYVKKRIDEDNRMQEQFIELICVENDFFKISDLVAKYSAKEKNSKGFEMRKWRVLKMIHLLNESDTSSSLFITSVYDFLLSYSSILPPPFFYTNDIVSFFNRAPKTVFEDCNRWLTSEIDEIKSLDV